MGCKRVEKKKPSRLWTMSVNQVRTTLLNFKVQGTNGYHNSNKRGDDVAAMQLKGQTPTEEPSRTRVSRWPNDVARTLSSRLNNSKVSLQSDVENSRPSTSRLNNVLGSRQKYTEKPMLSSSGPKEVSLQSDIKNARPSTLRPNNGLGSRQKYNEKPMPPSSGPNKVSLQNDVKNARSSTLRPNNGLGSRQKYSEKPMPPSSGPNKVSLQSDVKNARSSTLRPNNGLGSRQKYNEKPMPPSSGPNKVSLQSDVKNARSSTLRPNNGLGYRQKYSEKPMPFSSGPNNCVVSSQKNRNFSSSSITGSVSREKNVKKPRPSSSMSNNRLVSPQESAKKPMPPSPRTDAGGAYPSKNIEMFRPSPPRPNNSMISSLKDITKSRPSSSSPNGGSVPPPKNIEGFMSTKPKPSRLWDEFSSRKPTFIGSKDNSNSTFSISNKLRPSLVHDHSSNAEMSTQLQSEELWKAKEASTSSLALKGNQVMHGVQPQTTKASCMTNNMEQNVESMSVHVQLDNRKQLASLVSDGKADDGKYKSKMTEPLLEEKLGSHVDDGSAKENSRQKKRVRKYYENDDADDDDSDQYLVGAESGTAITETAVVKDCHTEVSYHFISESFKLRQYSSLPIDEPIWSGIIKTCSKEYVSLAAHLSTKYCDTVSKLTRSLQPMLEVTKLSRLEAWPESFKASKPTDDNIALYFFPDKMRQDTDLDQLVKEVVENDMVLRAVVDEAELLMFPSVLLPEQYQTFQGRTYLWGVFRPRKEKCTIVEEQHGGHCAQEEMGKQHTTHCGVGKKGHMVAGLNMDLGLEAPEEADGQGMEPEQTPSMTRENTQIPVEGAAWASSAPTMPAAMSANDGQGATSAPTMPAAVSANDGLIHSEFSVPTGAMLGFVARQTPRLELLIEEMRREGAVVVAMRGEMIGSGLGQATATG